MKKIPVKSLRAGQSFTEPVYVEGNSLLVPAGIAVRKKDIDRLESWGIEEVYTDGAMITESQKAKDGKAAEMADKKRQAKSVLSLSAVQENKGAYRTYIDLIERLENVFSNISSGISVEVRSIDNIAGNLLHAVREQRDQIIGFILGGEVTGHSLSKSSVNTAILSALIAMELKLPNHKIMQITTGALLHDVGMLRLPKEILEKKGGLTDAELQRMQAHPLYTYKIICKELLYPEDVGVIALQHHERWDGEGYPRRIAGTNIDIGARIVSVADAFEAMVSEKPYRNSMMGYQAMKNLLSDNSRRFDPDVLKAFIQTMGIYPIGSIILLNNGAIARVVEVRGDAPLRPNIRILIDEFGKVYKQDEGDLIELLTEKSLFIARALDPKEINKKQ
ncbi:HD-GYP domain-containing protein [Breznakiella homolactica]|uniref:HD-GYP domain-containing protein n=1 Tax=Breznakiella homolactica TaxID=2798577 RepID=A0A7T7XNW5_9SPIR|nr:HD-GYP domain-containing protein [Breznakiella homolactica]QQO09703.1 HD-GYP domain-containing protein [Breznakiella homolactica]